MSVTYYHSTNYGVNYSDEYHQAPQAARSESTGVSIGNCGHDKGRGGSVEYGNHSVRSRESSSRSQTSRRIYRLGRRSAASRGM